MAEENISILIESLKSQLKENEGELAYWGEPIHLAPTIQATPQDVLPSEKADQLKHLQQNVIGDCRLCPLSETRTKIVFGVGNPEAAVMFIGEGPGFDEDRIGDPFVGKAGQLLDKILAAINLDRTKVYIANIVKCHPMVDPTKPQMRGNDRPPTPEEIEKCIPF